MVARQKATGDRTGITPQARAYVYRADGAAVPAHRFALAAAPTAHSSSGLSTIAWIAIGLGLAALLMAGVFIAPHRRSESAAQSGLIS